MNVVKIFVMPVAKRVNAGVNLTRALIRDDSRMVAARSMLVVNS
jgi:hypothetical protein